MSQKSLLWQRQVMGIVNVTPDSFSDGGRHFQLKDAVNCALEMVAAGASIIDIGGESTRPGADPISIDEECSRVIPVIEALHSHCPVHISIDTRHTEVMQQALSAGATMINDVNALRAEGAVELAAKAKVPVCLMHMQGTPETMQSAPNYDDAVKDIYNFLAERVATCTAAGVAHENIIIDPGFGFGKTLEHNVALLKNLHVFQSLDCPLLVGISRKTMIGQLVGGAPAESRLSGSLAAAVIAWMNGAQILRVHDVEPTMQALGIVNAVLSE